ncbi:DUF305 domain-containing protein [Nonomuraea sp. NPDC050536]|uniref:DUF305 domain-containing protein n=1 Tax=Nonomuraea sp. NPDC050536 TaxID=3364366 RepID=UPI0037C55F73
MIERLVAALALALVAACGTAKADDPVNAEDVMFVQMMVPHNHQGIEIVRIGSERATNQQLKTMAKAIETTQQDEVEAMLRWLHAWDQPLQAPQGAHAHHGGMPETDRRQIAALTTSKHFERDLVNLLVAHQDDAIRMADAEVHGGANPTVKDYARRVQQSRKAEIQQLLAMLKQ